MSMPPTEWAQVKELFASALGQDAAHRSSFLKERCPDADVRAEVERLLAEHNDAGAFLSKSPIQGLSPNETGAATASVEEGEAAHIWESDRTYERSLVQD